VFGRPAPALESLGALSDLIARGEYPSEPRSIAEALMRHIDPAAYWALVTAGDIHPNLVRPRR
jgi:hypothetical protein